eukprot:3940061-Rhodomonas_salina.1
MCTAPLFARDRRPPSILCRENVLSAHACAFCVAEKKLRIVDSGSDAARGCSQTLVRCQTWGLGFGFEGRSGSRVGG